MEVGPRGSAVKFATELYALSVLVGCKLCRRSLRAHPMLHPAFTDLLMLQIVLSGHLVSVFLQAGTMLHRAMYQLHAKEWILVWATSTIPPSFGSRLSAIQS